MANRAGAASTAEGSLMVDGIVCCFTSRLGVDPETRFLANGAELVQFSVLPNDSKAADGAGEWVRVSIFREKLEDVVAAKLTKGVEAYVKGRIQLGRWQAQDGTQRAGLRVNAWLVQPMGQIGRAGRALRAFPSQSAPRARAAS